MRPELGDLAGRAGGPSRRRTTQELREVEPPVLIGVGLLEH
eukprot:CAMPEP_0181312958 /NCGR_PEP_ID=MMETSP1101-20121128/13983_1 /TAXON_ID=46948 /ORGANISM="Rhodomonas abbreviata, Strain Caron Lab Isolate" /LENGTH=40 /DNA_ID= /DNA_START= /DNA_END= /DNA_ORIENTATION=